MRSTTLSAAHCITTCAPPKHVLIAVQSSFDVSAHFSSVLTASCAGQPQINHKRLMPGCWSQELTTATPMQTARSGGFHGASRDGGNSRRLQSCAFQPLPSRAGCLIFFCGRASAPSSQQDKNCTRVSKVVFPAMKKEAVLLGGSFRWRAWACAWQAGFQTSECAQSVQLKVTVALVNACLRRAPNLRPLDTACFLGMVCLDARDTVSHHRVPRAKERCDRLL